MSPKRWYVGLAALFVALAGWYLLYTQQIVRALRADSEIFTRIYAEVMEGLTDPEEGSSIQALRGLQLLITESGVPFVMTGPGDTVLAVENLPFDVDLGSAQGQERVRGYINTLDQRSPPVGDPEVQLIHYGPPPILTRLRWIPWLQAGGLALVVLMLAGLVRYQRRVAGERAWTVMARELAHQLGTPISSLHGWVEVLKLPAPERPGELSDGEILHELDDDVERLERVTRRFELIGREPALGQVDLTRVLEELEGYFRSRLPSLASEVELVMEVPPDLPAVRGHHVLLSWALENVLKNSLDALAGRGGRISITCSGSGAGWVDVRIADTGPGIDPAVRDDIFEPGVTTKASGWGVGLTLARRIVQGVHRGKLELVSEWEPGATFNIRLPSEA
ncbi:MAG: ATP-binding protein [Gammaproteobacteria bacterium]|nr:ATP-binding protein [Gammaproteobacteria bacterium]